MKTSKACAQVQRHGCPETETAVPDPRRSRSFGWAFRWAYALTGFLALVWFLVRVIPKPSRASYPCQRVAMPMASSFVLWLVGLAGTVCAFRTARRYQRQARYALAGTCALAGLLAGWWALSLPVEPVSAAWEPADALNSPIGVSRGIHPGRVVWVHDPDATAWDGSSRYWWSPASTDQAVVDEMLSRSVRRLAGASSDAAAWKALFLDFNRRHGRGDVGYRTGEGIAVKINMNVVSSYGPSNGPFVSPQVVRALLSQLTRQAGVPESAISVYDASRLINDPIYNLCHSEFPAVSFVDNDGLRGRRRAEPDNTVPVFYSGPGAGASGTTRLPRCVVGASYLINLALLRGHSLAGVTLCAKNHFGSVWRPDTTADRGWKPSNLHGPIDRGRPMGGYNCLVDLMGHEHLDGKSLLFMIDGLFAAVNQGARTPSRWRSTPFDNDWTSSLLVSQDGVAIDSVALDLCRSEPTLAGQVRGAVDNYLHEAALAHDPPSGTFYDPEGDGSRLASLGVHEHWNNAIDKDYSRNLGTGDGIELLVDQPGVVFRRGDANADGSRDVADAVFVLSYLFSGGARPPPCEKAADVDDTGTVDVTDAVYLLNFLFSGGTEPGAPFAACGPDPTVDELSCVAFPACL